jgi:hypothetical protein
MMDVFCSRAALQVPLTRFTVYGEASGPDDTAEDLEFEDGDLIEATVTLGHGDGQLAEPDDIAGEVEPVYGEPCEAVAAERKVHLVVQDYQKPSFLQFIVRKSAPLVKLMAACCTQMGVQMSQASFSFDGVCIAPDDTAEKLERQDEDVIAVVIWQAGMHRS